MRKGKRILAAITAIFVILLAGTAANAASDGEIKVRRVEIMLDSVTVRVNQTRTLYAVVTPRNADDQTVDWESSNWEVVTVDGDGTVTGISPGTAEITATSNNGKVGRCTVTVPDTAIKSSIFLPDVKNDEFPEADITGGELLRAAALRVDVEKAVKSAGRDKAAQVTYRDKTTVSTAALRGASYTARAESGSVRIKLQTLNKDGSIQGQMTIDPEKAPSEDADLKVSVYTDPARIESAYETVKARFGEDAPVVRLVQKGGFGMGVRVAAKTTLSADDMDTAKLYRYADGAYTELEDANMRLDANGYLHFTTAYGGIYVLSFSNS